MGNSQVLARLTDPAPSAVHNMNMIKMTVESNMFAHRIGAAAIPVLMNEMDNPKLPRGAILVDGGQRRDISHGNDGLRTYSEALCE